MKLDFLPAIVAVLLAMSDAAPGAEDTGAPYVPAIELIGADRKKISIEGIKVRKADGKEISAQEFLRTAAATAPNDQLQVDNHFLAILGEIAKLVVLAMLLERALAFVFELRLVRLLFPKDDELAARDPALERLNFWEELVRKGGPWAWVPSTARGLITGGVAVRVCYLYNHPAAVCPGRPGLPARALKRLQLVPAASGSS